MNEEIIKKMVGQTFSEVIGEVGGDLVTFKNEKVTFQFAHEQDCCESVAIDDICGDLEDLVGVPIVIAEESTSHENPDGVKKEYQDSFTWTFYKFVTIKGFVTLRWYGESNGYYSESVNVYENVGRVENDVEEPYSVSDNGCGITLIDNEIAIVKMSEDKRNYYIKFRCNGYVYLDGPDEIYGAVWDKWCLL